MILAGSASWTWWQWCLVIVLGGYAVVMAGFVLWMLLSLLGVVASDEGETTANSGIMLGLSFLLGNVALALPLALGGGIYVWLEGTGAHWFWALAGGLVVAGGSGAALAVWVDRRTKRRRP